MTLGEPLPAKHAKIVCQSNHFKDLNASSGDLATQPSCSSPFENDNKVAEK